MSDYREEYLENSVEDQRKNAHRLWWMRLLFAVCGAAYALFTCFWIFMDVHLGTFEWFDKGVIAILDLFIALLLHEKYTSAMTELKKRIVTLMTYRERRPYVR